MNVKKATTWYIIIELPKNKNQEKILQAARGKKVTAFKGTITLIAHLTIGTIEARWQGNNFFKVTNENNCQHRTLMFSESVFHSEGGIKTKSAKLMSADL